MKAKENLSTGGKSHKGNQYTEMEGFQKSEKVPPINTTKEMADYAGVSIDKVQNAHIFKTAI